MEEVEERSDFMIFPYYLFISRIFERFLFKWVQRIFPFFSFFESLNVKLFSLSIYI